MVTMRFNPKVSIVIPVYNGSNYLHKAIDSALAQTYKNTEVIIVNDGSNDDGKTEMIAKSYKKSVKYYYKNNGGVASAVNFGISKMTGTYFSWLSHDDLYVPNKIDAQVEYLSRSDNKDIILYSDFAYIDENGQYLGRSNIRKNLGYIENFDFYAVLYSAVNICTLLIPTKCFAESGLFDERLLTSQDYELLMRFSEHYKLEYISLELVRHRFHANQGTKTINTFIKERDEMYVNYLRRLTKERIASIEANIPLFYIRTALGLMKLKYMKIAKTAFRLFIQNFFNCRIDQLFKNTKLLIIFLVKSRFFTAQ